MEVATDNKRGQALLLALINVGLISEANRGKGVADTVIADLRLMGWEVIDVYEMYKGGTSKLIFNKDSLPFPVVLAGARALALYRRSELRSEEDILRECGEEARVVLAPGLNAWVAASELNGHT